MPKRREYLRGNMRIRFNSGNREFDRQVVSVISSPSIGGGVVGGVIRAYNDTECNGHYFEPGHLQRTDLYRFSSHLPFGALEKIKIHCRNVAASLYVFYHWGRQSRSINHGALLLRDGRLLKRYDASPLRAKSFMVLDEAIKYLSEDYDENGDRIKAA